MRPPEKERDQHIVTGERDAQETPRRLVAAHNRRRLNLLEQAAAYRRTGRAGPNIRSARARISTRCRRDRRQVPRRQGRRIGQRRKTESDQPGPAPAPRRKGDNERERNADIIRNALLKTERARRQLHEILEIKRAENRGHGNRRDEESGRNGVRSCRSRGGRTLRHDIKRSRCGEDWRSPPLSAKPQTAK